MLRRNINLGPGVCFIEGDPPDPAGGGAPSAGDPPAPTGVPQDRVDQIVKDRVEATKRQTMEAVAKDLGVSVEEAKKIIADATAKSESEKSEAQKAREAADKEKGDAETEKAAAAKERLDTKVERHLIRALPAGLKDEEVDAKVARLTRLIDVEPGADDDAIKKAVDALKKDVPELFGGGSNGLPPSDPPGTPPKDRPNSDAFKRGEERAKQYGSGATTYAVLEGQK